MNLIQGTDMLLETGCALTVGKFESIHLGHQSLIAETRRLAAQYGIPSAVVTFWPHPRQVLGEPSYKPLFTPGERAVIMQKMDVDYLFEYPFDRTFTALSPDAFCDRLFTHLRARAVVIGESYRFGHERAGTVDTMVQAARLYGAELRVMPHRLDETWIDTPKISTSVIRTHIATGSMEEAARMLGFRYFIQGRVQKGNKIGRTLGFPTVNIRPDTMKLLPPDGVYATRTVYDGAAYDSITNIGVRPTITHDTETERTVESFILDYDGDLYTAELVTEFLTFIRPERRFASVEALREQIKKDISQSRIG